MCSERAQAGAFLPQLLEKAGLINEAEATEGREENAQEEEILDLNAVLVYKKVVQGLIYSPPDCDKYLALDAERQVSVALPPTLARLWQRHRGLTQCLRE